MNIGPMGILSQDIESFVAFPVVTGVCIILAIAALCSLHSIWSKNTVPCQWWLPYYVHLVWQTLNIREFYNLQRSIIQSIRTSCSVPGHCNKLFFLVNPRRMRSEGYSSWFVCLSVCLRPSIYSSGLYCCYTLWTDSIWRSSRTKREALAKNASFPRKQR